MGRPSDPRNPPSAFRAPPPSLRSPLSSQTYASLYHTFLSTSVSGEPLTYGNRFLPAKRNTIMQIMRIGIPKEIKSEETRVAITPSGVSALVAHGHQVLIEQGAGSGSSIPDDLYRAAGAQILSSAKSVWEQAQLILKVKEPLPSEYSLLRPGL